MSELIDIDIPYTPVVRALRQIINQLGERRELMASLAGIMHRAVEDNFAEGGRPKWQDLHPGTIASREKSRPSTWPGQILVRTGQLAASVQAQSDNDQAVVGTNKVYAAIQQFGGQTRPHVIKARNKRALAFGGVVVRQVKHPGRFCRSLSKMDTIWSKKLNRSCRTHWGAHNPKAKRPAGSA